MFKSLNYNTYIYILVVVSITAGIWNSQYINDGYHWGFIYSNSIDLLNGKKIYSEIFLEYGLLQTLINFIIIKFINISVFSIQVYTIIIYSASFFFIFKILKFTTHDEKISFYCVLMLFIINPWAISPWPIYHSFFFSVLFIYFFINNSKFGSYISGFFLFCAYLTYTTLYNFVIISFLIAFIIFNLINKFYLKKKTDLKFFKIFSTFLILLFIFLIFLYLNDVFFDWIEYQKIPFIVKNSFNLSFVNLIIDYSKFIFIRPVLNLVYEPQWIFYSILFISNIILFIIYLKKIFYKKQFDKKDVDNFIIILFILFLNFVAQVKTFTYFSCSLSLAIISFAYLFKKILDEYDKLIITFVLCFIVIFSLFNFNMKFSKFAEDRFHSIKYLKNLNKESRSDIKYFKHFKWHVNYWNFLNEHNNLISKIKKNCNKINGINLTDDSYLYLLIGKNSFQKIPFYLDTSLYKLNSIFDKDLKKRVQDKIDNNIVYIISHKNNDKDFNLSSDYMVKKIYKTSSKTIKEEFRVIYPKNCS